MAIILVPEELQEARLDVKVDEARDAYLLN